MHVPLVIKRYLKGSLYLRECDVLFSVLQEVHFTLCLHTGEH